MANTSENLLGDLWIVWSLPQNSIRCGDAENVVMAAKHYRHQQGHAIWHKLPVIAGEHRQLAKFDLLERSMRNNVFPAEGVLPIPNAVKTYIRDVDKIRAILLDRAYSLKTSKPVLKKVQS